MKSVQKIDLGLTGYDELFMNDAERKENTIIFVQDILVFPREQRKGVGTALMKAVLDRYPDVRQIELATDNTSKTVAFYKSLGFTEFSEMGCCGFMRCRQIHIFQLAL